MHPELFILSFIFISLLVPLTIGYILISYIKSLEDKKCGCSQDTRRKYIKYYGYFFIFCAIISILILSLFFTFPPVRKLYLYLKVFILVIHFLAAYVIFTYSKMLEDNSCECAKSWKQVFLKYYGYLSIGFLSLVFLGLLGTLFLVVANGDTKIALDMKRVLVGCQPDL